MIRGNDSSIDRPTPQLVAMIRGAGVSLWGGYLTVRQGVNIEAPWDFQSFQVARMLGSTPLAFCSGWDDPDALRVKAADWRVRLVLDDEPAIRPPGSWRQDFLDRSGAGLYGNESVHQGLEAPFHIAALYPGVTPSGTWPQSWPHPGKPTGWQYAGTHMEFGLSVDTGLYDDYFGEAAMSVLAVGDQSGADVHGVGAVYLVADPNYGPKKYVPDGATLAFYTARLGQPVTIPQFVLDRMEEEPPLDAGSYIKIDPTAVNVQLAAIAAAVANIQGGAVDPRVAAELDALAKHLGLGAP